jgi:hypothetical protein
MALKDYFSTLIDQVENSEIDNGGKDKNGFYKPTRTVLLRNLTLLRDLYDKPRAREMVKVAWQAVVDDLPPEWLILNDDLKKDLKLILEAKS